LLWAVRSLQRTKGRFSRVGVAVTGDTGYGKYGHHRYPYRYAYDGAGYGYPYLYDGYYDDGYYGGDRYIVRQRVLTRHGWRIRRVQICG